MPVADKSLTTCTTGSTLLLGVDRQERIRKLATIQQIEPTADYLTMNETFHVVAAKSELAASPWLHVELGGEEILLCRDGDEYFAVSYYCSHEAFTLEGGSIANNCITCPYHGAEFSLRTGEALSSPAFEAIRTYPVKSDEETISIGINA